MTTTCPACSFPIQFAPSKRVQVCKNCQSVAKTGKSLKEIAREKSRASLERSRLKSQEKQKQKVRLPAALAKFSKKGKRQALQIAATKNKMKREALDGDHVACEGCGNFFDTIDASHKIPLSKSSELAAMPGNIRLFCRGCHLRWESTNAAQMIELNCLVEDMQFLLDFDPERFWKIHFRLVDEYNARPTPKLGMVISELEKLE